MVMIQMLVMAIMVQVIHMLLILLGTIGITTIQHSSSGLLENTLKKSLCRFSFYTNYTKLSHLVLYGIVAHYMKYGEIISINMIGLL